MRAKHCCFKGKEIVSFKFTGKLLINCCTGKGHPYVEIQIKYEEVVVLPIRIVKSNVSSVGSSSERNMGSHDFIAIHTG